MKSFASTFGIGLLVAALLASAATAQPPTDVYPADAVAQSVTPFSADIPTILPGRYWLEANLVDNGLGFSGSFVTLGSKLRLFEDRFNGRWLGESQGHLALENGEFFGNIGIERVISIDSAPADVSLGVFYDRDGADTGDFIHTFNQVGVSGKIKTMKGHLIANGYFPLGTQNYTLGDLSGEDCFLGHNIILQPGIDSALRGFDVELRMKPYWFSMVNGTFDIGGYSYGSDIVKNFGGVRLRSGMQTKRGGMLNATVNYDDRFKLTGVLQMGWQFGGRSGRGRETSVIGQDLQKTIRNAHIVRYNQDVELLINPATGAPYEVYHVDNTAAAGGDGTFGRRFDMLAAAEAASGTDDIIFVYEGDGTTTGQDTGITLKDGQYLLGDGVRHVLPSAGGRSFLLCNDIDGMKPVITGPDAGDVVTLANRNTVAGFTIDGGDPSANGIVGSAIGSAIIRDNMFQNLTADAINITPVRGDITILRNMFENIGDHAIELRNIQSVGGTIAIRENIIGTTLNGITNDGIHIEGYNSENDWLIANNTITNIGGDGIEFLNGRDPLAGIGGTFTFRGNTIDTTGGHGINFTNSLDADAVFDFTDNTISNAALAAIHFENMASSQFTFTGTTFLNNTVGLQLEQSNGMAITLALAGLTFDNNITGAEIIASAGSTVDVSVEDSTFENNTGDGLRFTATGIGSTINLTAFDRNIVQNNGGRGVFMAGGEGTVINAVYRQNMFLNNAMGGLIVDIDGGMLDLLVGGTGKGNLFDGNGGAGIGVVLRGDATGRFAIDDNTVVNTVDDPTSTIFNGEGIQIRLAGNNNLLNSTASLPVDPVLGPSSITNNNIGTVGAVAMGNASHGILIHAEDESRIGPLVPGGLTPGFLIGMNNVSNNGDDGINVLARDSAIINDMLITLNTVDSNTNDGVHITAQQSGLFTAIAPFGIVDNELTNNGANGINLSTLADGQIAIDIFSNIIDTNAGSGILDTSIVASTTDTGSVTGLWSFNTITNNAMSGIDLSGSFAMLRVNDNVIDSNGMWGIDISGPGTANFVRDTITNNGQVGDPFAGTAGGVNIDTIGPKNLLFVDDFIGFNTGHGMRIVNNSNAGPAGFVVTAIGNTFEGNTRRGVSVFNQGTANTTIDFRENKIASNGEEGFYIVNTASITQDPDATADIALVADGAITARPQLRMTVNENRIINNGALGLFTANGLVLRVGTSDGGYTFFQDGAFADNNDNGILDRGGVLAEIRLNTFGGNFGDDVHIESFVSTVDPAGTGGTWTNNNDADPTNDVFAVTSYEGDPLARLDLLWNGNVFNTIAVTNPGAAYTNGEDVFKSRTTAQTPGGPFAAGTRPRNAQRLAARRVNDGINPLLPPQGPPIGFNFLYAGVGQSTFRLLDVGNAINPAFGFDGTIDFILDDFYVNTGDAMGAGPSAGVNAMPFGWNFFGGAARPQ